MLKKEIIWREILYQAIEKKERKFQQKQLAQKFGFSLSTVFNSLKVPRATESVKKRGRNFVVEDPEKLLYIWGTFRNLKKDIVYETRVKKEILEIENSLPSGVVFGCYSAYKRIFGATPADYDKVYIYASKEVLEKIKTRFPQTKKSPNLFILKGDDFIKEYGDLTTLGQTFADIWNLPEWYAHDFYKEFQERIPQLI